MSASSATGPPLGESGGVEQGACQPPPSPRWKECQVLIGVGVTAVMRIGALIVACFFGVLSEQGELENRVARIEIRIESMERSIARIENSMDALNAKVDRMLFGMAGDGADAGSPATADWPFDIQPAHLYPKTASAALPGTVRTARRYRMPERMAARLGLRFMDLSS